MGGVQTDSSERCGQTRAADTQTEGDVALTCMSPAWPIILPPATLAHGSNAGIDFTRPAPRSAQAPTLSWRCMQHMQCRMRSQDEDR